MDHKFFQMASHVYVQTGVTDIVVRKEQRPLAMRQGLKCLRYSHMNRGVQVGDVRFRRPPALIMQA